MFTASVKTKMCLLQSKSADSGYFDNSLDPTDIMVRLCCWKRQTPLEEVAEEQLRESKMGLKPKPFKTIG